MAHLKGHIDRITFSSDDNTFCVCKLKVQGEKELVTIVGNMVTPVPGELVEVEGKWTTHPQFGIQLSVHRCHTVVPATATGIQTYLGSRLIKGIGPVMARRIVKKFGTQSLDIIENHIDRLSEIDGIGQKRIEMIKTAWDTQKEVRSVMVFLQSHGVSAAYAAKIFKTYGQEAIHQVKKNPYNLAKDISGIGFILADRIAKNLGLKKQSLQRIEAGLEYVLYQLADDGHVCYPYDELCEKVQSMLDVSLDAVFEGVKNASGSGRIVVDAETEATKMVYLKTLYACENGIAKDVLQLKIHSKSVREIHTVNAIKWMKTQMKIRLAEKQEEAVKTALIEKVLVITGGPGTGKTTLIKAILKIFKAAGAIIKLAAPTGRAAKKMSQATWESAQTIHRLLDYSIKDVGFRKNKTNPIKCDVLIIDEASMIDTILMFHLLRAVPKKATLVLVGDVNQLPSVGPGNVLNDLIVSGVFSVVELDTIFRQAKKSLIVVNAHRINKGMFPVVPEKRKSSDFYFIEKETVEDVLATIVDLVHTRLPNKFNIDPVDDIQVLSPMHRGLVGAGNLNHELQKILNPDPTGIQKGTTEFKVSDKVMQIRNNYDKHVYNGDIGRIEKIDAQDKKVVIDFDGRKVAYDVSNLDEIVLAYAVSVHKSQGSEYPVVVIPVVTQHYVLLQRNLIYTAVTRGKKLVVLVGSKKALAMAIHTAKSSRRYTQLSFRLKVL